MEKFFSCHAQKQLENVDTDTGGPWDQYNQCHKTKPKPHSWNTIGISSCDWEANTRDVHLKIPFAFILQATLVQFINILYENAF